MALGVPPSRSMIPIPSFPPNITLARFVFPPSFLPPLDLAPLVPSISRGKERAREGRYIACRRGRRSQLRQTFLRTFVSLIWYTNSITRNKICTKQGRNHLFIFYLRVFFSCEFSMILRPNVAFCSSLPELFFLRMLCYYVTV